MLSCFALPRSGFVRSSSLGLAGWALLWAWAPWVARGTSLLSPLPTLAEVSQAVDKVCVQVYEQRAVYTTSYRKQTRQVPRTVRAFIPVTIQVPENYTDHVYLNESRWVPRLRTELAHSVEWRVHVSEQTLPAPKQFRQVRVWYPVTEWTCVPVDHGRYQCGSACPACQCQRHVPTGCNTWSNTLGVLRGSGSAFSEGNGGHRTTMVRPQFLMGANPRIAHQQVWVSQLEWCWKPVTQMRAFTRWEECEPIRRVQHVGYVRPLGVRTFEHAWRWELVTHPRWFPVTRQRLVTRTSYQTMEQEVFEEVVEHVPYTTCHVVKVPAMKWMPRAAAEQAGLIAVE